MLQTLIITYVIIFLSLLRFGVMWILVIYFSIFVYDNDSDSQSVSHSQ